MTGQATTERMMLWQTEGAHVPEATSAADILEKAGLDWGVELVDLYVDGPADPMGITPPARITAGRRKAIIRDDTHAVLGVVKSRYVPFSNVEVMSFLDSLVDSGEMLFEAAWSWHGGETVGVAMRVPNTVKIAGFDEHTVNMLVRTSHDGGGSLICAPTLTRIACTNMVNGELAKATRTWKLRHTSSLAGKVAEARKSLQMTYDYVDAWNLAAEELLNDSVTEHRVRSVATEIFGEKKADVVVEHWLNLDDIADFRRTRYGAYNALTDFAQWVNPRNPNLDSATRGAIQRQSNQALQLLTV